MALSISSFSPSSSTSSSSSFSIRFLSGFFALMRFDYFLFSWINFDPPTLEHDKRIPKHLQESESTPKESQSISNQIRMLLNLPTMPKNPNQIQINHWNSNPENLLRPLQRISVGSHWSITGWESRANVSNALISSSYRKRANLQGSQQESFLLPKKKEYPKNEKNQQNNNNNIEWRCNRTMEECVAYRRPTVTLTL